jgi:nitrite reductase (NADH) small subunit
LATATKVGNSADLPEGACRSFDAGGRKVAVSRVGGVLHAMDGTCPHRGGPLGEGTLADGILTCPWHGWRFEARTGRCVNMPGKDQACFAVREESGSIIVEI